MANIQSGYLKTKNGVQLMSTNPYPIGAIYLSVDSTNPSKLFGGTWQQLKGGFLYSSTMTSGNAGISGNGTGTSTGVPSTNITGSTTLTIDQMPSHSHQYNGWAIGANVVGGATVYL